MPGCQLQAAGLPHVDAKSGKAARAQTACLQRRTDLHEMLRVELASQVGRIFSSVVLEPEPGEPAAPSGIPAVCQRGREYAVRPELERNVDSRCGRAILLGFRVHLGRQLIRQAAAPGTGGHPIPVSIAAAGEVAPDKAQFKRVVVQPGLQELPPRVERL